MADAVGYSFPAQGMNRGYTFLWLATGGEYRYRGGDPLDINNWLLIGGELDADPDTSTWGAAQAGARWFNKVDMNYKGWNGAAIILVG